MIDHRSLNRRTQPLLEKLGLSRNEAKCYLACLALECAKVSDIAKHAHINRVNAYGAIKTLAERGFIQQEVSNTGRRVTAAPLSHLLQVARDYQQQTSKLRWKIEDIIPQLEQMVSKNAEAPSVIMGDVMFFRGADVFERVLDRSLEAPAGSTNRYLQAFDYFQTPEDATYDEEYYIPRRLKKRIKARVLYGPNKYALKMRANDVQEMRETRFLPPDINMTCYLLIYGSEAALLWMDDTQTLGIVIRGGPLCDLMKMLFEMVWQIAGEHEKKPKK